MKGHLPRTGFSPFTWLVFGLIAVMFGAVLLTWARGQ